MDTKKRTWTRVGIVGGLLALSLLGARFGRGSLVGHAAGDDGAVGCSAPQEVSATKGDASGSATADAGALHKPAHPARALLRRWHSHTHPTPAHGPVSPADAADPGANQ